MPAIASVLCPGPSLGSVDQEQLEGSTIIAVNRAIRWCQRQAHTWVCVDDKPLVNIGPEIPGKVIAPKFILTRHHAKERAIRKISKDAKIRYLSREALDVPSLFNGFSAVLATYYALECMDAGVVNVYGCDLAGEDDWDGSGHQDYRVKRDRNRWTNERNTWKRVLQRFPQRVFIKSGVLQADA